MNQCLLCQKPAKNKFCTLKCAYEFRKGKPSGALGKSWKLTKETRNKQSKAWKNRKKTSWYKDFIKRTSEVGKKNKGFKHTQETKDKMSEYWLKNPRRYWLGKKNKKISGDKHPQWKGGVTPLKLRLRKSADYKRWRKSVFERDNYTCKICGDNKGGNLEADHHPIGFKDIYKNKDISKLWDINNGRTLCKKCHSRKTYANTKTT